MLGAIFVWETCPRYVVPFYNTPGVRARAISALNAMRAAGQENISVYITFAHDPVWQIPSAQGRLTEPYRTNLINLFSDIRKAGFMQLTAAFQPVRSNDMKSWTGVYDPALSDENWSFIHDVRPLVKEYGPASTHIVLLVEGAPNDWDLAHNEFWRNDLIDLYRNYVDAFGHEDVTVSSVASGAQNWGIWDDVERMQNLIDLLRASARPLPTWFALSVSYDGGALADLRAVDEVLSRNGLAQPLVIQEAAYQNRDVAQAAATFVQGSDRPLVAVTQWPHYTSEIIRNEPAVPPPRCASSPYVIDAYAKALWNSPPSKTLRAWVGAHGQLSLLTPYGQEVKALFQGRYTIIVRDTSSRHGFRLFGDGLNRESGIRFRGAQTWRVNLRSTGPLGAPYTYASQGPGGTHRHFPALAPG